MIENNEIQSGEVTPIFVLNRVVFGGFLSTLIATVLNQIPEFKLKTKCLNIVKNSSTKYV